MAETNGNGKAWASDGNLLKVAGLIIATLISAIWVIEMGRQNTADQNITTITSDVSAIKGELGVLDKESDYQSRAIDLLNNRMSNVEQEAITTRDKADALEQRVNKQETNYLEKKYRLKARADDIAMERAQKHHANEVNALTAQIRRQAVADP
jgi:chromosome segregation ATPase